jgi:FkbM family methyltransferase
MVDVFKFLKKHKKRISFVKNEFHNLIIRNEFVEFEAITETVGCDVGSLEFPIYDSVMRLFIARDGYWEFEESALLRKLVKNGQSIINVGANVGYTTLLLSKLVGTRGQVIAIEPEKLNINLLRRNLFTNHATNVTMIGCAAAAENGQIDLFLSPDNAGDHRTTYNELSSSIVKVPCYRLDHILEFADQIDGLVIDAQGFDHRIIEGASFIHNSKCKFVMTEFWPAGILEAGDSPQKVFSKYQQMFESVVDVPSGSDLSTLGYEDALEIMTIDKDHTTLLLTPN